MINQDDIKKEYVCRKCNTLLGAIDLDEGKCPHCNTDEHVF